MAEALRKIYFGKAIIFQQALLPCSLSLAACKDNFLPARNNCRKYKDSPLTCILCKFLTFELLKTPPWWVDTSCRIAVNVTREWNFDLAPKWVNFNVANSNHESIIIWKPSINSVQSMTLFYSKGQSFEMTYFTTIFKWPIHCTSGLVCPLRYWPITVYKKGNNSSQLLEGKEEK